MLLLRRVVFYLFLLVFLIGAPLIVFYGLGYIYKPHEEKGIIKTGLVYLSSAPPGASIYVGKRRFREKTPTMIRELLAGEYPIKLVLKSYLPWSQTVPVEGGKATVLDKILLRPQHVNLTKVLEGEYQDFLPIPETEYFLVERKEPAGQLDVYDWEEDTAWRLFSENRLEEMEISRIYTMRGSPYVLFKTEEKKGKKFLWVNISERGAEIDDLTNLFVEDPDQVGWAPEQDRYLFSFQQGYLNRLDLARMTIMPKFADEIHGYGFRDRELYVLQGGDAFSRMDFSGRNVKLLMKDSRLFQVLFGTGERFSIHFFSDHLILFLGNQGKLVTNRLPYQLVEREVLGFDMDKRQTRLVLWTKDALGIVDFSGEARKEDIFERGPEVTWVYRKGKDIQRAFWVYQDAYVLFQDQNDIFLLELETFGKPNLDQLLSVKKHTPIHYVEQKGRLYYLDEKSEKLMSLEIVPKQTLIDIPLPLIEEERKEKKAQEL